LPEQGKDCRDASRPRAGWQQARRTRPARRSRRRSGKSWRPPGWRFGRQRGQGEAADSWVAKGPNQQLSPQQLEQALGSDVIENLVERTGLSRDELLSRLTRTLPEAVDKY